MDGSKSPAESMEDQLQQRTNNVDRMSGGKVLGKKPFTSTSRLVMSTQVWLNTIPTRNCDILMTFPPKTDDAVLMWVLSRLRSRIPELIVHVRHHSNTNVYGFYFTASYENILKGAEELGLMKPVKEKFGGGKKEFVFDDRDCYEGVEDHTSFLNSQERQNIVQNILYSLRAKDDDQIGKIKFGEGQGIVPILLSKKIIDQVLPLHNNDDLEVLRKTWVKAIIRPQPLDKICDYFGVKIAMYFAYLGHYTRFVSIPTFVGILFWLLEKRSQFYDDVFFVAFAFLNVVWATLYLEHWKRHSAELAYKWGTLDAEDELLTEPRPLFHGHLKKSHVTGRMEPYYPAWKRNLFRYCVSLPVIAFCLSVVFAVMWCIFELQDWINSKGMKGPHGFALKLAPKIMLAVSIGILDDIYKKVASWLNDKENYRLEEQYENHLIIKIVLFQFVNSFLSLFYIAFYLQDMNRLKDQLAALLITRQIIGNVKEAVIPFVISKVKLLRMGYKMTKEMDKKAEDLKKTDGDSKAEELTNGQSAGVTEVSGELRKRKTDEKEASLDGTEVKKSGPQLTQAEIEASQKGYEGTFEDYLEMLVQFGYVTLFSSAFPLAALCAFLNNVIEIRSDAFKLCFTFQRPFGQRVQNIGTWQDALEVMSVIAVMVNCALIGMSDLAERLFPGWGTTERLVLIVALEHLILIIKFLVAYAIPDIPHWVAEEKARLEFLRRDALKKLEGKGSVPPTPTSPNNPQGQASMFSRPQYSAESTSGTVSERNYGRRGPANQGSYIIKKPTTLTMGETCRMERSSISSSSSTVRTYQETRIE